MATLEKPPNWNRLKPQAEPYLDLRGAYALVGLTFTTHHNEVTSGSGTTSRTSNCLCCGEHWPCPEVVKAYLLGEVLP